MVCLVVFMENSQPFLLCCWLSFFEISIFMLREHTNTTHFSVFYLCLSYLHLVKSLPNGCTSQTLTYQVIKDHSAFFVLLKVGLREMRLYMECMRSSNCYNTPSKFVKIRRFRLDIYGGWAIRVTPTQWFLKIEQIRLLSLFRVLTVVLQEW